QLAVSIRPALKRSPIWLTVDMPPGIEMDSYPGAYGQVLTNLVLNTLAHAFPDRRTGAIELTGRQQDTGHVEIVFSDDGVGMSEEVRRHAFEPFFPTPPRPPRPGLPPP